MGGSERKDRSFPSFQDIRSRETRSGSEVVRVPACWLGAMAFLESRSLGNYEILAGNL